MFQLTYLNKTYPVTLHWDKYNCYWFEITELNGKSFRSITFRPAIKDGVYAAFGSIMSVHNTVVGTKWTNGLYTQYKSQDLLRVANMAHMHELFTAPLV